jgi:hypothetical protein
MYTSFNHNPGCRDHGLSFFASPFEPIRFSRHFQHAQSTSNRGFVSFDLNRVKTKSFRLNFRAADDPPRIRCGTYAHRALYGNMKGAHSYTLDAKGGTYFPHSLFPGGKCPDSIWKLDRLGD